MNIHQWSGASQTNLTHLHSSCVTIPNSCEHNLAEITLNSSTKAVSVKLADILTEYLKNNWADSQPDKHTITATTNMVTELQLDSFQVMEFMLEVEDHFDIAIDLESLSNIQTINDLSGVVVASQLD